ncbi:membrane protein [Streptomyces sp. F-3]|nr:membrane protein [Streptomyces sp. F-3]
MASAATFVWLGMVLAISFLEAPLKFRAPGVTIPIGLGIGRLVFRALNLAETVLAVVLVVAVATGAAPAPVLGLTAAVAAVLLAQLAVVRPRLNRRSDRVLAGEEEGPRSRGHLAYVVLEVVKAGVLIALGVVLAAA